MKDLLPTGRKLTSADIIYPLPSRQLPNVTSIQLYDARFLHDLIPGQFAKVSAPFGQFKPYLNAKVRIPSTRARANTISGIDDSVLVEICPHSDQPWGFDLEALRYNSRKFSADNSNQSGEQDRVSIANSVQLYNEQAERFPRLVRLPPSILDSIAPDGTTHNEHEAATEGSMLYQMRRRPTTIHAMDQRVMVTPISGFAPIEIDSDYDTDEPSEPARFNTTTATIGRGRTYWPTDSEFSGLAGTVVSGLLLTKYDSRANPPGRQAVLLDDESFLKLQPHTRLQDMLSDTLSPFCCSKIYYFNTVDLTPIDKEGTSIAEVDSDGITDYYRGNESNHGGNNHQRQNDDHSGRDGDSPSDGNGDQQGDNSPNASSGNNNNSDDDDDDGRKRRRLNDGQSSNPSDEDHSDDEDDDEDQNDDNDAEVREVIGADGTPEQPPEYRPITDSPSHPATGILKPSTFGTPTIHPPQRQSPWPLDQYVNSIRDSPKMRPSTNHDEEETWSNSDYSPPIRYGTPLQPVDLRDIAAATGVARAASPSQQNGRRSSFGSYGSRNNSKPPSRRSSNLSDKKPHAKDASDSDDDGDNNNDSPSAEVEAANSVESPPTRQNNPSPNPWNHPSPTNTEQIGMGAHAAILGPLDNNLRIDLRTSPPFDFTHGLSHYEHERLLDDASDIWTWSQRFNFEGANEAIDGLHERASRLHDGGHLTQDEAKRFHDHLDMDEIRDIVEMVDNDDVFNDLIQQIIEDNPNELDEAFDQEQDVLTRLIMRQDNQAESETAATHVRQAQMKSPGQGQTDRPHSSFLDHV